MNERRRGFRAVAAMFALNGAFFGTWASRVPAVAEKFGLEPGALGLVLLAIGLGAVTSFPLAGRWSDQLGAARVTLALAAVHLVAVWLVALAPSVGLLAAALLLFGAMHGAMDVTMNAWAGEVERAARRPIMPVFHAVWSLGAGLGAATGWVAVKVGVGIPLHFIAVGTLAGAVALAVARGAWVSEVHLHEGKAPVFAFPTGALLPVALVAMGSSVGEGGMADWSAIFLVTATGANEAAAALGYTVFSVAMVTVRFLGSGLVAALGPVRAARLAGVSAAAGALVAVIFASYPVALAGFVLMGIGYALIIPLAFSRAANDPVVRPGRAIAAVATLGYGGILLGPPILGFIAHATSVRFAFGVIALLAVMISLLAGALRPPAEG